MLDYMNKILTGDCREILKHLPNESIDCVVTSPPYYALRDFGMQDQLGLEPTINQYLEKLCSIFDQVQRVLKKKGTCWVNMGDTYGGPIGAPNAPLINKSQSDNYKCASKAKKSLPAKCLIQIPFRFSIEMCNRGWILRNVIIWHKPNGMPSSVKDRFTVNFEYLFFFVKNKKYWFEQQFEDYTIASEVRYRQRLRSEKQYNTKAPYKTNTPYSQAYKAGRGAGQSRGQRSTHLCVGRTYDLGRNKRCIWKIPVRHFPYAHFAVYPPELIVTPIMAGCPEYVCSRCGQARQKEWQGRSKNAFDIGLRDAKAQRLKLHYHRFSQEEIEQYDEKSFGGSGKKFVGYTRCRCKAAFHPGTVLDPFLGSGTTAVVARQLGRNYVGIELNPKYVKIAKKRITQEA